MNNPVVEARHCEIRRGNHPVIPDMTLEIPAGVIFGLVGPSGSGKSSIMRAMVGLGEIASGELSLFSQAAGSSKLRDQVGYQPQEGGIWLDLSARESLSFIASLYRVPRSRINDVLQLMELDTICDRACLTLSGGEQRRVGLAMAILSRPQLLILDEPTVGLDPRLRHRLWNAFRGWTETGTTLVVSTHVMDEAASCDQIAVVMDGRIIAIDTPAGIIGTTGASNLDEAMLALFDREEARRVS